MKIQLIKADITALAVDAIVNAANSSLLGGGGVDGAIHRKGGKAILDACLQISAKQGGCKTGEAVYTTAGNLPCEYVIHTVGPVWQGGNKNEEALLRNCYLSSINIAEQLGVNSIAFPNISTGMYGFPKKAAAAIAIDAIKGISSAASIAELFLVCFDEENYLIYKKLMKEI